MQHSFPNIVGICWAKCCTGLAGALQSIQNVTAVIIVYFVDNTARCAITMSFQYHDDHDHDDHDHDTVRSLTTSRRNAISSSFWFKVC